MKGNTQDFFLADDTIILNGLFIKLTYAYRYIAWKFNYLANYGQDTIAKENVKQLFSYSAMSHMSRLVSSHVHPWRHM